MNIPSANDDAWNTAEGKRNGEVSLIRYRPNLEHFLGNPDYSQRLVIIWDFSQNNSNGMPSNEQSDDMRNFEDVIVNALDPDRSGILVLVLTNAGMREWHYYIKDISEVGNRINNALSEFPKLPINLQVEEDQNWGELKTVYELCN